MLTNKEMASNEHSRTFPRKPLLVRVFDEFEEVISIRISSTVCFINRLSCIRYISIDAMFKSVVSWNFIVRQYKGTKTMLLFVGSTINNLLRCFHSINISHLYLFIHTYIDTTHALSPKG
jgi:hypothetical protein